MKAFRKRIVTMLVTLESHEATSLTAGSDLLPHAPTEDELRVIWERYAVKDPFVLETLLQILKMVRYPIEENHDVQTKEEEEEEESIVVKPIRVLELQRAKPSYSPAIDILLKVVFSAQSSRAMIDQALLALKFQFANELDGFMKCVEQHAGMRPEAIARSTPDFIRRCLLVYGFVVAHTHDPAKLKSLLGAKFPRVKINTADNTTLTALLTLSLQSSYIDIRRKAIEIVGGLCLSSEELASRCFPLFDRALSKDVESIRIEALKILSDLCFLYPSLNRIEFMCTVHPEVAEAVQATHLEIIAEFLSAPCKELQFISAIAIARLLYNQDVTEEPERMLIPLVDKYFESFSEVADFMLMEEHQQLMELIYVFFEKYTDDKAAHQSEIANSIVLLVVEALYEQVIPKSVYNPDPDDRINQLFALQADDCDITEARQEPESSDSIMLKRKIKFLMSFLNPTHVPAVIESLQRNAATSFQAEMSYEEALTILGLSISASAMENPSQDD